jgi:hypothetical protein
MKQVTKLFAILTALAGFGLTTQNANAANTCTDTTVLELGVNDTDGSFPAEFDVTILVKRVDTGAVLFAHARHYMVKHTGVQRIERFATTALLSGAKLHLCWDDSFAINKAFLKK